MTFLYYRSNESFIKFKNTREKMTRTLKSFFTWIRDIFLPSSNIPLISSLAKMTLRIQQFPFTITKGTFVLTNLNQCWRILSTFIILLHIAVVLKWLLDQWLEPVNHSIPIWKFVLMYYCLTLFSATVAFTVHFTWLKGETIFLLNSALQVERNVKSKGEFCRCK